MKKGYGRARQILRVRRERKKEGARQESRRLETIIQLLRRLGHKESTADHVSRLRVSEKTLRFLLDNGYTNIADLQLSVLTRVSLFRARKRGKATIQVDKVAREVLEALIEYNKNNLRLLEDSQEKSARGF
jgi:hypothetical protein